MVPKRLTRALDRAKVRYAALAHKKVYTAFDLATTLGRRMEQVAKTVLVKADRRYVLVVVPANARLDLRKIAKALRAKAVSIAPEAAIKRLKYAPGTTPPFGSLVKVDVLLDRTLARAKEVVMRTGSLTDSISMRMKDFIALERPTLAAIGAKGKTIARRPAPARKVTPRKNATAGKRKATPRKAAGKRRR